MRGPLITFFPRDYSHWLVMLAKVSQVRLHDQWGFRRRGSDSTNGETVEPKHFFFVILERFYRVADFSLGRPTPTNAF